MSIARTGLALVVSLAIAVASGCSHAPPARDPQADLLSGTSGAERLLTLGDPVGAAQLLRKIPPEDAGYAYAQELLLFAQRQADAIARQWIAEVDGLVWEERFGDARARTTHLLDSFPLSDELRIEVERRAHETEQGLTGARANLEELDRQAEELLLMGSLAEAVATLEEAFVVARQIRGDAMFERERILMALRLRSAGAEGFASRAVAAAEQGAAPAGPVPPVTSAPEPTGGKRSNVRSKRAEAKSAPTMPTFGPGAPSSASGAGSEVPASLKVRKLLASAARFLKRQAYFNAIVAYLKVRELEPQNTDAQAALESLEPHRQVLISDLVDSANRHFLSQDLDGAEPYFRKVLLIDPFNEQAVQGLQMFENLKRIRNEGGAAAR